MLVVYITIFFLLVVFSAFFSSAETSLLSLNKIKLNLKTKKKVKKALVLSKILEDPEKFFSTILIGNNFVNIAAASISTVLFTHLIVNNEELSLLVSTVVTTTIILFFAEIIPKSYAFRRSEKLSYIYAYPIKFFTFLFYPFVKVTTMFTSFLFKKKEPHVEQKGLTIEEIKHFLANQPTLIRYSPESLRMVNEIIDIAQKDIKNIMTPRLNLVALEENSSIDDLKKIILEKGLSKIPVYKENLDHITGFIHATDFLYQLLEKDVKLLDIKSLLRPPIFISEYSSLNYAFKQFKKHRFNMAVIVDEYGATIGVLTLNDIFSEILGEIQIDKPPIKKILGNTYRIRGSTSVEEVNEKLHITLPEKPEYTTMSGLFIYHFGKFPKEKNKIKINDILLEVKRMGKRKIEELMLIKDEN
jgi:CBS domain containing-hemolysin-like protein